jgi:hypothetical protein
VYSDLYTMLFWELGGGFQGVGLLVGEQFFIV